MDAPKVFISHATEDKGRFVLAFAEALRLGGMDAWVDQWEIQAGDSIVRRIYSEGIQQAAAVVVVLSCVSIAKPWVQDELDAAVVKRINEQSKLIPVVLDGLTDNEIPAAVRHLLRIAVPDTNDLRRAVQGVSDSVFNVHRAPPVGGPGTTSPLLRMTTKGLGNWKASF